MMSVVTIRLKRFMNEYEFYILRYNFTIVIKKIEVIQHNGCFSCVIADLKS